jgi:hypothetical protein
LALRFTRSAQIPIARARGTIGGFSPAVSSLGGFRMPAHHGRRHAPEGRAYENSNYPCDRRRGQNGPSLTASENLHRAGLMHCNTIGETLNPSHRSALDLGCKEKDRLAAVSPKSELGVLVRRMREHRKPSASCATSRVDHRLPKSRRAVLPRRWGPAQRRIPRCSPAGRQC